MNESTKSLLQFVADTITLDILPQFDSIELSQTNGGTVDLTPVLGSLTDIQNSLDELINRDYVLADLPPYSLTEQLTENRWINGKPLYRKTIDFGYLPNNTTKSVAHSSTDIELIFLDSSSSFVNAPNGVSYSLEHYINPTFWNFAVSLTNVILSTSSNYSTFRAYFTILYTKVSDTAESPVLKRVIE